LTQLMRLRVDIIKTYYYYLCKDPNASRRLCACLHVTLQRPPHRCQPSRIHQSPCKQQLVNLCSRSARKKSLRQSRFFPRRRRPRSRSGVCAEAAPPASCAVFVTRRSSARANAQIVLFIGIRYAQIVRHLLCNRPSESLSHQRQTQQVATCCRRRTRPSVCMSPLA